MTDILDRAQFVEERERAASVALVRSSARQLDTPAGSAVCRGCADLIEPERLAACPGAQRCLVCQEAAEKFQRLFPRGAR